MECIREGRNGTCMCLRPMCTTGENKNYALAIVVNKEAQYIKTQSIIELNVKYEWIKEWLISRVTPCRSTFHFFEQKKKEIPRIFTARSPQMYSSFPFICSARIVLLYRQINGIFSYQTEPQHQQLLVLFHMFCCIRTFCEAPNDFGSVRFIDKLYKRF